MILVVDLCALLKEREMKGNGERVFHFPVD